MARARQRDVKRGVPRRQRARRGVADDLAEMEILEEIARIGFDLAHRAFLRGGPA